MSQRGFFCCRGRERGPPRWVNSGGVGDGGRGKCGERGVVGRLAAAADVVDAATVVGLEV